MHFVHQKYRLMLKNQLQSLNTLINKCGKAIIGNTCLRWSSNRILNRAGLSNIWQMLIESGLNFIHKLQVIKIPSAIYQYYKVTKNPRSAHTLPKPKYIPKSKVMKNFLFYKFNEIYYDLDPDYHAYTPKKFKREIKYYVINQFTERNIPTKREYNSGSDTE